ncbi:hypothetical protein [Hymenobacter amundsenii]|nr:hypothetical protein [Hymenobacter amundsenii]
MELSKEVFGLHPSPSLPSSGPPNFKPRFMKAFFLALSLFIGLGTAAQAQLKDHHSERPGNSSPTAAQADALTRQMSQQLSLNEAQIIKLRTVNKIKLARTDEIKWQFHEDPLECKAKLIELQSQYENECGRILTPSQLSALRDEHPESVPTPPSSEGGLG